MGVLDEIERLFGRGVGGHDDQGTRREAGVGEWKWVGREVGVVHEADVRLVVSACCEVELGRVLAAVVLL